MQAGCSEPRHTSGSSLSAEQSRACTRRLFTRAEVPQDMTPPAPSRLGVAAAAISDAARLRRYSAFPPNMNDVGMERPMLIRAGTPATVVSSGTLAITRLLVAITTLLPIVIGPTTLAPDPISTLSPIERTPYARTTPVRTLQFAPILVV